MRATKHRNLIAQVLFASLLTCISPAQTFKVLHRFTGAPSDGEGPFSIVIRDSMGNLYGTSETGGTGRWGGGGTCGTGFVLNKAGKEMAHLSFQLAYACIPMAGLLRDSEGNFYGTTVQGGDTGCFEYGCGAVYKVNKMGKGVILHEFTGSPDDGEEPEALLVQDAAGNLYGTTFEGGAFQNAGTVFKVAKSGDETILHNFCSETNCADGYSPYAGVILDQEGNIYGAAAGGGASDAGAVYMLDPSGNETVLYNFRGGSDGSDPFSVLVFDAHGNLYGTTRHGGNLSCSGGAGCGVVFKLSPQQNGTWKESTLYTFCSQPNCTDGQFPMDGPLVIDTVGNLYGTTYFGGKNSALCNGGCGVVFKIDTSGNEAVLHTFMGGADGADPWAGVTMDATGNLYGTTAFGGDTNCFSPSGCGIVFEIIP